METHFVYKCTLTGLNHFKGMNLIVEQLSHIAVHFANLDLFFNLLNIVLVLKYKSSHL